MLPVGYCLHLAENKVVHGIGPVDPNPFNSANRFRKSTSLAQLTSINPVYPAELSKLRNLIEQYAKGQIPGINMESLEYTITKGAGQCLQSYFATFNQTTLKSCNTYQATVQAFLNNCFRLIQEKRDAISNNKTATRRFQYFHNPSDKTAAIKALDALGQEVGKLWNKSNTCRQDSRSIP